MPMFLTVQRETDNEHTFGEIPSDDELRAWVEEAQIDPLLSIEITLRIVDKAEIQMLNKMYRGLDKPTNVLSFSSDVPDGPDLNLIGDVVICADIVAEEAKRYGKRLKDRWAHMVVHGCLHIQGLDHEEADEREFMEIEEKRVLKALGIHDPYQVN
jgi:probable rRNA maturation factor